MRHCLFITLFTVGYVFNGFSQTEIESKRIVIHNAFVKFFRQHAAINEIRFNVDKNSDSVRLEILEHSNNEAMIRVVYDLNHKGDRYSFEKKYGRFIFPFSVYKDFIDPRASYINIEGRVRQDSVFMSINQWYEPKNQETEEDKIFEKVETNAKYEKGNLELAREMETYFQRRKPNDVPPDSVLVLFAIINPDKTIVVDKILEGNSEFAKSVVDFINKSGPWTPMEACGRKVKAYKKIYARLNRDNTFDLEVY